MKKQTKRGAGTGTVVVVVERRKMEMSDEELMAALNLQPESSIFRAMLEVCDRYEDELHAGLDPNEKPETRLEAATAIYVVKQVRARFIMLNRAAREWSKKAAGAAKG